MIEVSEQSGDIALGVNKDGAGDQGIMYGYASDESEELMLLPIILVSKITMIMDKENNHSYFFGSDGIVSG